MRVSLELQPCCGQRSGIGNYTFELVRRLKNVNDLEFTGNLFKFPGYGDSLPSNFKPVFPINICRLFPYGVYRRIWNWTPSYDSLFSSADVTHFFNYIVPPKVSGKIITTIYDLTHLRYPETMNSRNLERICQGINESIDKSDTILTISDFSKRELIELLGVEEKRIAIVPPAISLENETDSFENIDEKYQLKGTPYILYVGTIEPRKNLARLIKAFTLLKKEQAIPHKLFLAGGMGWKTDEITIAVQNSYYKNDIIFTGYIPCAEKNALYQNASVFVFPSLYEGFGIPILEAMSWGAPVVCSNAASMPEVSGHAAELVDPFDVEQLAESIFRVLSNPSYRKSLINMGFTQAAKYSWDESVHKLINLYQSLN